MNEKLELTIGCECSFNTKIKRIVKLNPSLGVKIYFLIVASVVVHAVTLVRGGVSRAIIGTLLRLLNASHLEWWT